MAAHGAGTARAWLGAAVFAERLTGDAFGVGQKLGQVEQGWSPVVLGPGSGMPPAEAGGGIEAWAARRIGRRVEEVRRV